MRRTGWTKNWRKKWDNPTLRGRINHLVVWDWILSHAEWHKEIIDRAEVRFNGNIYRLKLGQLTCGSIQIASDTGAAASTVRRVINDLVVEQLLEHQTDSKCSLITVKNWEQYQDNEQPVSSERAASEQPVSTKEEGKKLKIEEETSGADAPTPPTAEEDRRMALLLSAGLRRTNPAYAQKFPSDLECSAKLDAWVKDFEKLRRIDKATEEQISFVLRWLFEGTSRDSIFWRSNIQSGSKLREQFARLVGIIKSEKQMQQNKVKVRIIS